MIVSANEFLTLSLSNLLHVLCFHKHLAPIVSASVGTSPQSGRGYMSTQCAGGGIWPCAWRAFDHNG